MARDLFRSLVSEQVGRSLVGEHGFKRADASFRRPLPEVTQLVSFQKSRRSTKESVLFAVNLGVASKRILAEGGFDSGEPTVDRCHWHRRLPSCQDPTREGWWTVRDSSSCDDAAADILHALKAFGLPDLESLQSDAALRDMWLTGRSPGLTEVQRLVNLSILLQAIGPGDEAAALEEVLTKIATEKRIPLVIDHLRRSGATR